VLYQCIVFCRIISTLLGNKQRDSVAQKNVGLVLLLVFDGNTVGSGFFGTASRTIRTCYWTSGNFRKKLFHFRKKRKSQ